MSIETNTRVGLVSKALILCGEKPLSSESDNRYGATVGLNLFEMIYENELQTGDRWRFAMKKGSLSRLLVEPLNEYQYAYQLPTDMLLLIGMTEKRDYEIYGDRLYTDAETVEIEYMFKPTIDKLPAYFSSLLVYALAKDMIQPITENSAKASVQLQKYVMQRGKAQFANAQARPARPAQDSPFTDSR